MKLALPAAVKVKWVKLPAPHTQWSQKIFTSNFKYSLSGEKFVIRTQTKKSKLTKDSLMGTYYSLLIIFLDWPKL